MSRRMAERQRGNRGRVSDRRQSLPQNGGIRPRRLRHRAASRAFRNALRSACGNTDQRQRHRPMTRLPHTAPPGQVIARQRTHGRLQGLWRSLKQHMSPLSSLPRTNVHDLVGRTHHLRLMLYHDHRVASIPERPENADQPLAVARVQTHTRFVQDVEGIDQARAQAGRQIDPCRLSATEGAGGPIDCQIAQAHRLQVSQPGPHLAEDQPDRILR